MNSQRRFEDGPEPEAFPANKIGVGLIIYQQIAGVLGAFSLMALIQNFFPNNWVGFILYISETWDQYVKPVSYFILHLMVYWPLKLAFGWNVEPPDWLRDYVALLAIMVFSMHRAPDFERPENPSKFHALVGMIALIFLLPFVILIYFQGAIFGYVLLAKQTYRDRIVYFLTILPFIYLMLLYLANACIVEFGLK